MNINKVSQSLLSQSPEFVQAEYPLFNKFLEYYYRSQEKTGLGQNILNNFLSYLDIACAVYNVRKRLLSKSKEHFFSSLPLLF